MRSRRRSRRPTRRSRPSRRRSPSRSTKATDKARHADKFYFKGITITPGGFLELAGIYRAHNTGTDITSNFNALPYPNARAGLPRRRPLLGPPEPPVVPRPGWTPRRTPSWRSTASSTFSAPHRPPTRTRATRTTCASATSTAPSTTMVSTAWGCISSPGKTGRSVTLNSKGITPRNEVTPPQIDAQYLPGFSWARQPQVRVTADFLDHKLWIAASAGKPADDGLHRRDAGGCGRWYGRRRRAATQQSRLQRPGVVRLQQRQHAVGQSYSGLRRQGGLRGHDRRPPRPRRGLRHLPVVL